MVLTVEPGIYLEGRGGVRIEDTVLVTDTGREAPDAVPEGAHRRGMTCGAARRPPAPAATAHLSALAVSWLITLCSSDHSTHE